MLEETEALLPYAVLPNRFLATEICAFQLFRLSFISPLLHTYPHKLLRCCVSVTSDDSHEVEHVFTSLTVDEQSVLVPSDQAASQSWDQLCSELVELSEITGDLARMVKVCGSVC